MPNWNLFNDYKSLIIEPFSHNKIMDLKIYPSPNFKGILDYTEDPIVSVDIIGNKNSCLFDAQLTSVIDKMVKIVGWYDNEIGYSSRLIDLITFVSKK